MSDPANLDRSLRELFASNRTEPPGEEELVALVRGELSSEAEDALLERAAGHPDSMDLLLDLRRAAALESDRPEALSAAEVEAGVAAVMESLPTAPTRPMPAASFPRRHWLPWAAAAVLTLTATFWGWTQMQEGESARLELAAAQQQIEELTRELDASGGSGVERRSGEEGPREPLAGVRLLDLFPSGGLRGDDEAAHLELGDGEQLVTLILTPGDPEPLRSFELRLLEGEQERWRSQVRAEASGAVVVAVPAGFLTAGHWRLRLESDTATHEFTLEIKRSR